jgi:hypothetical protein
MRAKVRPPHAVIIGAQKAATTGLYRTLATHPDVVVLRAQEAGILHQGAAGWESWLHSHEPGVFEHPEQALVAKLATAMYFSDTLGTIRTLNGRARVVAILRHPVDRMLSLHRYAVQRGLETRSPEDALRTDIVEKAYHWRLRCYSEGSRYAQAIDRVRRTFGAEALFVDYADVHSGACLPAIQDFLGLPRRDVQCVRANESHEPRSMALARATASPALQRIAGAAVPLRWRAGLRSRFEEWNSTSRPSQQAPISAEFRSELIDRHLPDVLAAEQVTARELPLWRT